jgi:Ca-activated chloride channel family protein
VRAWIPTALILLALVGSAAALARPRIDTTVADNHAVVVLLVDVSGSMQADDISPTRIEAAVGAMKTLVNKLPSAASVGLVEFSSAPTTIELPTTDHSTVLDAIDLLAPQGGTALGDGIAAAVKDVRIGLGAADARGRDGFVPGGIVLLSDGAQNRGTLQPIQGAATAKAAGVRIYTVAFGTAHGTLKYEGYPPVPVPPDPATMQAVAHLTGGKMYTAQTAEQAQSVYSTLGSTIARARTRREITSWVAFAAAILLVAAVAVAASGFSPILS